MAKAGIQLEEMTLTNVAGGVLPDQFHEAVTRAAEVLQECERYQGDTVTVRVLIEVELSIDKETRSKVVSAGTDLKLPKQKRAARPLYIEGGVPVVEPEPQRLFPLHNAASGKDAGKGE